MIKAIAIALPLALLLVCASVFCPTGSLRADSTATQAMYGDVNQDSSIDIFDLLAILRLFGELKKPLEVAATVGGHWLTEPTVYSYSQSWQDNGVRDQYQIYSSREIGVKTIQV